MYLTKKPNVWKVQANQQLSFQICTQQILILFELIQFKYIEIELNCQKFMADLNFTLNIFLWVYIKI